MANQTVTTVLNYDDAAISGLANGETLTIDGGAVTVNADVRWNQQAAVFGAVTLSATLGGSFLIDGTQVWEVPFSAASGNVPTQAALGSNGVTGGTSGATGELTRVWATGSLTPATAGGAMPSTGFIKLRSKTGTFQNGETISLPGGATVTASGAGKRSWIHVVGRGQTSGTASRLTIPRLGTFNATGDWYDLGTTNGADGQTFQFPVADMCPAIWIETAAGSNVYEVWLNAGDRWTASPGEVATADKRGMFFGMNAATGVITLAARTGNTAGLKPPSGCKVRVPNVILSQADGTTPNYASNILPTTAASRYGFTTSNSGSLTMSGVSCNWHVNPSAPFAIQVTNAGVAGPVAMGNVGTTVAFNNVGVGIVDAAQATSTLSIATVSGSVTLTDVRVARRLNDASGQYTVYMADVQGAATLTRCRMESFQVTHSLLLSAYSCLRTNNVTLTDCVGIAGQLQLNGVVGAVITNYRYASRLIGTTTTNETLPAVLFTNGTVNGQLDGVAAFDGIANVHPYTAVVSVVGGASEIDIRNIGSPASPYDMGTANACGVFLSTAVARNVALRRCYLQNTRTSPWQSTNAGQNLVLDNVWGDAADSQALAALNATARGGRYTPSTTGQSAVYGTHWQDAFTSTTAGQLVIACNEPTASTADQCTATLDAGAMSGWTASGNVRMVAPADVVEWTMPYFMLGVTGFANTAPTITGTNAANHTLQFQYDLNTGAGWNGTWLALTGANLSPLSVNPALGVKLKVRATVNTVDAGNLLTYISIPTVTTSTAQATTYPFPVPQRTATIGGLVAGSRVQVYNVTTSTEILNQVVAGTSWALTYGEGSSFTTGDTVRVRVRKPGQRPYEAQAVAGASGWSLLVEQVADAIYSATTPANYTVDYANLKIRATGARAAFTAQEVVDIIRVAEATASGIQLAGFAEIDGLVELSAGVYTAITVNLSGWQLSWAAGSVTQASVTGGNIVGGIGGDPVEDVVGGPQVTVRVSADATVVTPVTSLLPGDITAIATAVRSELNTELGRIDVATSTRLAGSAYTAAPTASANATAVRSELATELGRLDVATSTRLAGAAYSVAPTAAENATAVRSELATELGRVDVATSTRLAASAYTVAPTAAENATAVRTELTTELGRLDVATSTRLATSAYTAAPTASTNATAVRSELAAELARIDVATSTRLAAAAYSAAPTAAQNATAVRTELSTELGRLDVATSTRLAGSAYSAAPTAADNATAVRTELATELGRLDVATSTRLAGSAYSAAPTAAQNATAVRSELAPELGRLDVATSTRLAGSAYAAAPTAADNATAVRSELAPELGRLDVATSTRLAAAAYTAPPTPADTATAVLSAAQATPIAADIQQVNGYVIDGAGTTADPWGPA
jgi:hypothetical protein